MEVRKKKRNTAQENSFEVTGLIEEKIQSFCEKKSAPAIGWSVRYACGKQWIVPKDFFKKLVFTAFLLEAQQIKK